MIDAGSFVVFYDSNDVKTDGFSAFVVADILVSYTDEVLSLLMVDGLLGLHKIVGRAGFYLDEHQFALVKGNEIHLLVAIVVVVLKDYKSLIYQIPRGNLFTRNSQFLSLLPAFQRPILPCEEKISVCHEIRLFI